MTNNTFQDKEASFSTLCDKFIDAYKLNNKDYSLLKTLSQQILDLLVETSIDFNKGRNLAYKLQAIKEHKELLKMPQHKFDEHINNCHLLFKFIYQIINMAAFLNKLNIKELDAINNEFMQYKFADFKQIAYFGFSEEQFVWFKNNIEAINYAVLAHVFPSGIADINYFCRHVIDNQINENFLANGFFTSEAKTIEDKNWILHVCALSEMDVIVNIFMLLPYCYYLLKTTLI